MNNEIEIISGPYLQSKEGYYKETKDGRVRLTNFRARIDEELCYHDGNATSTMLKISGTLGENSLKQITIPATDFASLNWIAEHWGMQPIVFPQPTAERDLRTIIQLVSTPTNSHIYTHTGWAEVEGNKTYLTKAGGIDKDGLNDEITVELPAELSRYTLPRPEQAQDPLQQSFKLINLGPKSVTWPLLLATYRAAIAPTDFAIHVAGRTGTYKSELASLFQSHYGSGMDARHLPASWSATANALEALAYKSKDAIIVVDDFVPLGTAWQVRTLQNKADGFIRGQGNQTGRARLTDVSSLQPTYYPRGIILSTGEDIPEGHSVRGRMMILELTPGDIAVEKLTEAQNNRPLYPQSMSNWIQWLAQGQATETLIRRSKEIRDQSPGIGHARTPSIIGDLLATSELLSQYCVEQGYFNEEIQKAIKDKARLAVYDAASKQQEYLTSADPVTAFTETIRQLLTTNLVHLKTKNGGIPENPTLYGWTELQGIGEMPTYKSNGPRLGWVDQPTEEILIDPANIVLIKKHSGGKLAITPQTLLKRLKEANVIVRTDPTRERNTVRATLEGHPHNVLALSLSAVMEP